MAVRQKSLRSNRDAVINSVVVTSEFAEYREQWDALVELQALPSPFLRSWWVENASNNPVLVLLIDDGELLGGAAFESSRLGKSKFAGIEMLWSPGQSHQLAADHLDIVAHPDHQERVAEAVLTWLHRPGRRILDFDGLNSDGILACAFESHIIERVAAPFAPLPDAFEEYIGQRPGKVRSTIKRTTNRVVKAGATFESVTHADSSEVIEAALHDLHELHDERWDDSSALVDSWNHLKTVLHAGISAGDAVIYRLLDDNASPVATEIDFLVGKRLSFYQAGRLMDRQWRGVGSALRAHLLEQAHSHGVREYDLLRGEEPYKDEWATQTREVVRVRVGVGVAGSSAAALLNSWKAASPKVMEWRAATRESLQRRRGSLPEHHD